MLVSARVPVAVEKAVKVDPVDEFELKGIRRPLAAYNVVGEPSSGPRVVVACLAAPGKSCFDGFITDGIARDE
jgi:hypothetical protein